MERLERPGKLVGPDLGPPRIAGDPGDALVVEPRGGEEGEPRRVPGREGPPAPFPEPPSHVPRPDQDDVPGLHRHLLLGGAALEVLGVNRRARPQGVHALVARDVEEDAAADDLVLVVLDAVPRGAGGGDQAGVAAAVHLAVAEDVAEPVPLGPALEEHRDLIVGETPAARQRLEATQLLAAGRVVRPRGDHAVDGVHPAERPALGAIRVEVEGAGDHLAQPHEGGGALDDVRRDEVEGPDLVFGAPAPPVPEPGAVLIEQRGRDGGAVRHRALPWCRTRPQSCHVVGATPTVIFVARVVPRRWPWPESPGPRPGRAPRGARWLPPTSWAASGCCACAGGSLARPARGSARGPAG